ncbi:MAG: cysteine-rich CWC family protein [Limnohabitans sp.]|nr:cysteine-rich CWC family protein [Limnohabitans sp.]
MTDTSNDIDPTRCPLCGGPNGCAMTCASPPATCWCVNATFTPALLQQVPPHLQRRSCICATCAQTAALPQSNESG